MVCVARLMWADDGCVSLISPRQAVIHLTFSHISHFIMGHVVLIMAGNVKSAFKGEDHRKLLFFLHENTPAFADEAGSSGTPPSTCVNFSLIYMSRGRVTVALSMAFHLNPHQLKTHHLPRAPI